MATLTNSALDAAEHALVAAGAELTDREGWDALFFRVGTWRLRVQVDGVDVVPEGEGGPWTMGRCFPVPWTEAEAVELLAALDAER